MSHWVVHLHEERRGTDNAAVSVEHKVYVFFSDMDNNTIAIDVFNTVSLRWSRLPPAIAREGQCPLQVPTRRSGQSAALIGDVIYMFGGHKHTFYTDGRYHGGICNDY